MKKGILIWLILLLPFIHHAQTTLFQDDFESGSSNWILGSSAGESWVIDNIYQGGVLNLIFVQLPMPSTPNQSAVNPNNPTSNYLKVKNNTACNNSSLNSCNAVFGDASATGYSAQLSSPLNTLGKSGVTVSFDAILGGYKGSVPGVDSTYAVVEYSLDNTNWSNLSPNLLFIGGTSENDPWQNYSYTNPALDNQNSVHLRVTWYNLGIGSVLRSIGIDNFKVISTGVSQGSVSLTNVSENNLCKNQPKTIAVNFNASGSFNQGNIFTAEMSDANGSFTNPTQIGSINSISNGNLSINAVVPAQANVGDAFKIRITSSNPASNSISNTNLLTVFDNPNVTITSNPSDATVASGQACFLTASGATNYTWSPAAVLNAATGSSVTATVNQNTVITVNGVDNNGCSSLKTIEVKVKLSVDELTKANFEIYPNPTSDFIFIKKINDVNIKTITVYNSEGSLVKQLENFEMIDVRDLPKGNYIFRLNGDNNYQSHFNVIVQ